MGEMTSEGEPRETGASAVKRRITRLHEVATELQTVTDPDSVYDRTITAAVEILGFEWCCIARPVDGYFELTHVSPASPVDVGDSYLRVGEGITGKTYSDGETIRLDRHDDHPRSDPAKDSFESLLSVPIEDRGVFQGYSPEENAFDRTDEELAELLIAHTSAALERIERERELKRQNERLERFASVVSHDMRGPLSVARANLELAVESGDESAIRTALDGIGRADRIIDDVLAVARGETDPDLGPRDLASFCERAWAAVGDERATLDPPESVRVMADADGLLRLLENLFRNAVDHGGDEVAVTVTDDGFAVEDNGAGFPDDVDEVFEVGATEGHQTGLGLAICSDVADTHGWTLSVDQAAEVTRILVRDVTIG